jgi:FkbM family methyltransferase
MKKQKVHPWFLDTKNYPRASDARYTAGQSNWLHRAFARYARSPGHPCKLRILRLIEKIFCLRDIVVPTACGLMRLNSQDYLQRIILMQGSFEQQTLDLIRRLLRSGDTFVDVGANIGQHSLWAASCVGESGRVLAVEPNPDICHRLLVNRRLNGLENQIDVAAVALADKPEVLVFEAPPFWNLGLSRQVSSGEKFLGLEQVYVASTTLRQLCVRAGISHIDVLKIDTEGSEISVFQGFFGDGSVSCRNIIFEYMPEEFRYGNAPEDYLELFRKEGYEILEIDGRPFAGGLPSIDANLWARKEE